VPFQRERLIGLRKAKGIRTQEELEAVTGIARVMLNRYEKGTKTPDADTIETLANKLDATMGYFHGHGDDYGDDYELAAIQMSFDILSRDKDYSVERKERCRRVLAHPNAPRTVATWRALSEMFDWALGSPPSSSGSSGFEVLQGGRS
jgi:transcriptional regulator with XRE-family HTH domain